MSKEEFIISLLKSKQSIAELFNNNNLDDDKIHDIRRIRLIAWEIYYPKDIEKKFKKALWNKK